MKRAPQPTWSTHDAAVWHTVDIVQTALASRLDERPTMHAPFPPRHGADERILAQGDFQLYTHTAIGDGSYQHSNSFLFATGGVGLAMTAGFAVAQAAGNASRRNQAAQDAIPRWVLSDQGLFWVSTAGFYLQTVNGLFPWAWPHVQSAQLLAPATLHLQGQSDSGSVSWLIVSEWAELAFVLWALQMHPQHPMLTQMTWVPPGWQQRCLEAGYAPPKRPPHRDEIPAGSAAAILEVGHGDAAGPVAEPDTAEPPATMGQPPESGLDDGGASSGPTERVPIEGEPADAGSASGPAGGEGITLAKRRRPAD